MTDEITFDEEPELPPVIVDAPSTKTRIGDIVWLDSSAMSMWPFTVKVREGSREQNLVAHYRVVTEENKAPRFETDFVPPGDDPLRDLEFFVKSESLQTGECHRLELAVSAAFFTGQAPVFFDAVPPGREAEVAYASWWLWEGPGDALTTDPEKARIAQSCPAVEDLLAPSVVEQAP